MTDTTPMSAAEARGYQALRGHLAALKLTAAAEALPAVLDAARAEGLSLTLALERLLAIECEATEARKLAGRLRFACLPTPATLAEFDYDAQPGVGPPLIHDLATCRLPDSPTARRRLPVRCRVGRCAPGSKSCARRRILAVDGAAQHRSHECGPAQEQDPTADYPEHYDRDD